jgi:peptide methionine sulfoxide reductase msrA/msrB|tara:strand:+ start:542 stop:1276 length:735 start_codon:yes stop_codon:yes gene_type:complete
MKISSLLFKIKQKLLVVLPLLIFSLISNAGDQKLNDTNKILDGKMLDKTQLVVFESETCGSCKAFNKDVMVDWKSSYSIEKTYSMQVPIGWELKESVWATPTIVMFENGKETARYTGYDGNKQAFWRWFGMQTLTPEQKKIAFESGTELPFSGSLLDNKDPGYYVDPITGDRLFRSDAKFKSGTGWPSFFDPIPGSLVFKEDGNRVEVLSASSGIHLGHVFNDGPPPSGKRYCINSAVLKFIAD